MKKGFALLLTLLFALGTIGCSNTAPGVEENDDTVDTDAPTVEVCSIEYLFGSVEDLNTYITTGSRDENDYAFAPGTPLEDMPEARVINARGYRSVYEFFTFDEAAFDSVEASFTFTESGSIIYRYYLDNILVMIRPAETDDLLECYKSGMTTDLTEDDVLAYSENMTCANGHVLRENADCSVMYRVVDGVKKTAHFIIKNFYVTVNGTYYSDAASLSEDFNDFMTDQDATAFSSFFSDDDDAFSNAVANAKSSKTDNE